MSSRSMAVAGASGPTAGELGDGQGEAVPEKVAGALAGASRVTTPGRAVDVSLVPLWIAGACTLRWIRQSEGTPKVAREPIGPTPAP